MDYRYIEQLLARYWEAETTEEEENILRLFFSSDRVPEHLERYKVLFAYEQAVSELMPSKGFEERVMKAAGIPPKESLQVPRVSWRKRLEPLYHAVAIVAVVAVVGLALSYNHSISNEESPLPALPLPQVSAPSIPSAQVKTDALAEPIAPDTLEKPTYTPPHTVASD